MELCSRQKRTDADTPHYQHAAQWVFPHFYLDKLPGEIDVLGCLILHPFLEIAVHEEDIVQEPSYLSCDRFMEGLSEITAERYSDPGFIILHSVDGRDDVSK